MTAEDFQNLNQEVRNSVLFDAAKITERTDGIFKYELFRIDDFFIEVRTGNVDAYSRSVTTYNSKQLPLVYNEVLELIW